MGVIFYVTSTHAFLKEVALGIAKLITRVWYCIIFRRGCGIL